MQPLLSRSFTKRNLKYTIRLQANDNLPRNTRELLSPANETAKLQPGGSERCPGCAFSLQAIIDTLELPEQCG